MPGFLRPQDIVDIEDIIAIFIVIPVILHTLARLRQDAAGISRRLVFEIRIANPVRCGEVHSQSLEWLRRLLETNGEAIAAIGAQTHTNESALWGCSPKRRLRVVLGLQVTLTSYLLEFWHWDWGLLGDRHGR